MMRQTSKAARPMDTAAQRAAILALFEREPYQPSREAVSQKTGIKLQTMTWRIRDLLAEDAIEELDAVDNKHPLRRKNAEQMPERVNVRTAPLSLPVDICFAPINAAGRQPDRSECMRSAGPNPAAPYTTAPALSNDRTRVFSSVRAVVPYCDGVNCRMSLSTGAAELVIKDKSNAFYEEAKEVISRGEQFRIYT